MYFLLCIVLAVGVAPTFDCILSIVLQPFTYTYCDILDYANWIRRPVHLQILEGQSLLCQESYTTPKFLPRVTLPALDKALCDRIPTNFNFIMEIHVGPSGHWNLSLPRIGCIPVRLLLVYILSVFQRRYGPCCR